MIQRALLLASAVCGLLAAQQPSPQPGQLPNQDNPSTQQDPTQPDPARPIAPPSGKRPAGWQKLSVKEKLDYDWRHLFDVQNIVYAGIGAALDQARDRPSEWGQGGGAFAQRYGSHLGQYAIQRSIMFPVQAIDGEDTRYFPSKRNSYQGRIGDALLHTIWRHSDNGGRMPAYSEFLGDYGAAALSRLWWPDRFHNGTAIFVAGSNTLLIDAGINVLHEFAPDIKHWLHLTKR
jgi:hypothetical protein